MTVDNSAIDQDHSTDLTIETVAIVVIDIVTANAVGAKALTRGRPGQTPDTEASQENAAMDHTIEAEVILEDEK